MAWVKRDDLTEAEYVGLVEAWRDLREMAAGSNCDCFRDAHRGRVWYPLSDDAARDALRLDELQGELMERLRAVAKRLELSWQGYPDMGWVTVGGFLRAEMAAEDEALIRFEAGQQCGGPQ